MVTTVITQALRKFESKHCVVDTPANDIKMFSPFGPMIGQYNLPATLIDRLNLFADTQVSNNIGQEFLVPEDTFLAGEKDSLAYHINNAIKQYLIGIEHPTPKHIVVDICWVVSQYSNTPSPAHFHVGDISGVLYLKTPEIEEAEEQKGYMSGRKAGYINFIAGGKQAFSKSIVSFKPKVGDLYIFPGWLLHVAEAFNGIGERRSLAFNANIVEQD